MKKLILAAKVLLGVVIAPFALIGAVVRGGVGIIRWLRRLVAGARITIVCPVGHPNRLEGRWSCGCGASYLGHAFGPCPICGLPAGFVSCERCGLAIRSPWKTS